MKSTLGLTQSCCNKKVLFSQVLGPYTFNIGDISGFSAYTRGGLATQVKVAHEVEFVSLQDALDNPKDLFILTDFAKFDSPPQFHLAFKVRMYWLQKQQAAVPPDLEPTAPARIVGGGGEHTSFTLLHRIFTVLKPKRELFHRSRNRLETCLVCSASTRMLVEIYNI